MARPGAWLEQTRGGGLYVSGVFTWCLHVENNGVSFTSHVIISYHHTSWWIIASGGRQLLSAAAHLVSWCEFYPNSGGKLQLRVLKSKSCCLSWSLSAALLPPQTQNRHFQLLAETFWDPRWQRQQPDERTLSHTNETTVQLFTIWKETDSNPLHVRLLFILHFNSILHRYHISTHALAPDPISIQRWCYMLHVSCEMMHRMDRTYAWWMCSISSHFLRSVVRSSFNALSANQNFVTEFCSWNI